MRSGSEPKDVSRKKRLVLSTGSALANQVITGLAGLILPVYIIQAFGSEVNGLIGSITQFLAIISFLDFGVGAVVQSALYGPLANKDNSLLSQVLVSAEKFYRKIAIIFCIYAVGLAAIYPIIANNYDYIFTATLVIIIAIGNFAQFFFGITSQTLLTADQKGYIQYSLHSVAVLLNLVFSIILIKLGASIHIVKLATTLVYLIRPFGMYYYVHRHYSIDKKVLIVGEPIKQKRNGFLQHVSSVVLDNTDVMVLTFFSTLQNISVYTVYYNVLKLVKTTFESLVNGLQSLMGYYWAKQDKERINSFFNLVEWGIHVIVILFFFIVSVLIVPFVSVYTAGITDADYINEVFGVMLTVAIACQCLRLPYMIVVKAAGHYKETQYSALIEMTINIVISVASVKHFGLPGIAFGTLVAMIYRSIYLAVYSYKRLLKRGLKSFAYQICIDSVMVVLMYISTRLVSFEVTSYYSWVITAVKTTLLCSVITAIVNLIFMRSKVISLKHYLKRDSNKGVQK